MMTNILTTELYWMALTILMTGFMWVPYIVNRVLEQGVGFALWDPQGETKTQVAWAERMMRAHQNAVENLVIFAPLVLALHVTGLTTNATAIACMVYFYARAAHYLLFTFGVPGLRIPAFVIAVVAQLVLALTLLGFM